MIPLIAWLGLRAAGFGLVAAGAWIAAKWPDKGGLEAGTAIGCAGGTLLHQSKPLAKAKPEEPLR